MKEKVREGYEKGSYEEEYRDSREIRPEEKQFFEQLFRIAEGRVLDLGCGTGEPFDRYFSDKGFQVTGVDIAENHVEQARKNVPDAEFIREDFFELDFEENIFDAVVSFFAIFHIPREQHKDLLEKIRSWVKEDGAILITMGAEDMERSNEEIGGEKMIWSSYTPEKNKKLVEDAGFNIVESTGQYWNEEDHLWILAEPEA